MARSLRSLPHRIFPCARKRLASAVRSPTVAAGALTLGFGDYANYWIADRQGRAVQRLNELYAGNGQVGFLITQRVDGKVIRAEGIQLLQQKAT